MDHVGRDTKLHIDKHCLNSNDETVNIDYFKILNVGDNNNTYRRRISEALFVKHYCPSLNVQDRCSFLIDFNCISIRNVNNLDFLTFRVLLYE